MKSAGYWCAGVAMLFACGEPPAAKSVTPDTVTNVPLPDSLVLTNRTGVEIWFTLSRVATDTNGRQCVERGLEIRQGGKRVQVPLLYTGSPPVLLNDSTLRATLWTHCRPGYAYRVHLRTGQPVREPGGEGP